jgi:hypothetical protein
MKNGEFLYVDTSHGSRTGYLVEFGDSDQIFNHPKEEKMQQYISEDFSRLGNSPHGDVIRSSDHATPGLLRPKDD